MDKLFNPQSVAIIGASRHPEKIGYQILDNLVRSGYRGKIFPVNPEAQEIQNLKVFNKISEINEPIDLALVVVPAKAVAEVLEKCVEKKVAYAIVISSGFSEIGEKGRLLQEEIKDVIINASPLRVVGPNCLGVINTSNGLNLTFAAPKLVRGGVSAVFQSGALGVALLDFTQKFEFGFAKFVSLGNKVDIEESEIIEYLANDPETKIIALYIEQISNLNKFFQKARYASSKKPIVILIGGVTQQGARAAYSHTAAMISPAHVNHAIFSQANLLVAKSIEEMLSIISILSCEPPVKDKNLAIITNAGGPGILATDAASLYKFQLPLPDKKYFTKSPNFLENTSISNPLDLTGTAKAKDYKSALNYFTTDSRFSEILTILTPQTATEIEQTALVLSEFSNAQKPIIASFLGDKTVEKGVEILRKNKVPHFEDPEEGIIALSKVIKYWEKFCAPKNKIEIEPFEQFIKPSGEALELIAGYNIPVPPSGIATTMDVALKIVSRIGMPVVVKNISKNIVHKYKAGKVILNVQSESFLKESIRKVGFPVLIQRMVDSPFEVIVGAKRDSKLGVIVTFGWGGIFAEDLNDISTRILPLTEYDLDEMIKETKISQILIREKIDFSGIKNIIIEICQIMIDFPQFTEMDLNPIKLKETSAVCVDARYK